AGACALVALLAARLPLGFRWGPPRSARLVPDVARGFAVGAVCAAGLLFDDNAARLAAVWHDDRAASVALLAGGAPLGTFLGTALGGFVAGCIYVLSGSLTVAALYHGLHNAPLKALGGAPIAAGRAGLAGALALVSTAALAVTFGWMVYRRGDR